MSGQVLASSKTERSVFRGPPAANKFCLQTTIGINQMTRITPANSSILGPSNGARVLRK